jgi:hypothetical protein
MPKVNEIGTSNHPINECNNPINPSMNVIIGWTSTC